MHISRGLRRIRLQRTKPFWEPDWLLYTSSGARRVNILLQDENIEAYQVRHKVKVNGIISHCMG